MSEEENKGPGAPPSDAGADDSKEQKNEDIHSPATPEEIAAHEKKKQDELAEEVRTIISPFTRTPIVVAVDRLIYDDVLSQQFPPT